MSLNTTDPNLRILCSMDESSPTATRANAASANATSVFALAPGQSSGSDGIPPVDDESTGRCGAYSEPAATANGDSWNDSDAVAAVRRAKARSPFHPR